MTRSTSKPKAMEGSAQPVLLQFERALYLLKVDELAENADIKTVNRVYSEELGKSIDYATAFIVLTKLEKEGFLTSKTVSRMTAQNRSRPTKVFSLTQKGHAALLASSEFYALVGKRMERYAAG